LANSIALARLAAAAVRLQVVDVVCAAEQRVVAYRRHPLQESGALMQASNIGTVKAVWPWVGVHIIPILISPLRSGALCCTGAHAHPLGDEPARVLVAGRGLGAWPPSLPSLCQPCSMPTLVCLPLVMVMTPMTDLLQLPQNERLALAIALWDSLDDPSRDGALPVDPALCAELDRRWANHRDNPVAAVPWDEVRSQLGIG